MSDNEMLEELREIKKLLTPAPKPPPPKGVVNEFITFISQYKVLGLAVAFILAVYIGNFVQALVKSLIMPLVVIIYPPLDNPTTPFVLSGGPILDSLITFVIVAFVVFLLVKIAARLGIN